MNRTKWISQRYLLDNVYQHVNECHSCHSIQYKWYCRSIIAEIKFINYEKVDVLLIYNVYGENATKTKIIYEKYPEKISLLDVLQTLSISSRNW